MRPFAKLEEWSEQNHSIWLDILRIILGIVLMIKGFMFIADTSSLVQLLNYNFGLNSIVIAQAIAIVHLVAGFLIIIGLATRVACLVQIPIVLAALLFVNRNTGGARIDELILSIIVFVMLCFFFIKGSGKFSAYYYLINSKRSRITDESVQEYQGGSSAAPLDKEANII